jgi:hypothetical protein
VRGEASNIALRLATLDAEGDRCIITGEEEFKERLAASSEGSYTRFHAWVSHGKDQGRLRRGPSVIVLLQSPLCGESLISYKKCQ